MPFARPAADLAPRPWHAIRAADAAGQGGQEVGSPFLLAHPHPEGGRGFDPRNGTVFTRCRICFAMLMVWICAGFAVAVPSGVASAEILPGQCDEGLDAIMRVPHEALEDLGVGMEVPTSPSAGGDYLGGQIELEAGYAGPAAVVGTAAASTTAAAAVAAFVATVITSCHALDWATRGGDALFCDLVSFFCSNESDVSPTYGETTITYNPTIDHDGDTTDWYSTCTGFVGSNPGSNAATVDQCRRFTGGWGTVSSAKVYSTESSSFTRSAVAFQQVGFNHLYPDHYGSGNPNDKQTAWWEGAGWRNEHNAAGTVLDPATVAFSCDANIGGACGHHPLTTWVIANATNAFGVFSPWPEVRELGWERVLRWEVYCVTPGTTSGATWVSEQSEPYFDASVSTRMVSPVCPEGQAPAKGLIEQVPTGVNCESDPFVPCAATGAGNWGMVVARWDIPDLYTAEAPEWALCLAFQADCGAPELEGSTCMWGGTAVPVSYCNPTEQSGDPEVTPRVSPNPDGPEVVPRTPTLGETITTQEEPDPGEEEPPPGVTVNVPIDEGNGPRVACTEVVVVDCYDDADDGECFPNGWGWFNPIEWVERPVKCALVWAFVPDDPGGPIGELQDELETQFPFSLGFLLIEFAEDLGTALDDPSGTGCFDMPSSFSFGSFTVPVSDVCVGDGVEPGSGTRQLLATLMIAPLLWAVCTHAVRTMRGVST